MELHNGREEADQGPRELWPGLSRALPTRTASGASKKASGKQEGLSTRPYQTSLRNPEALAVDIGRRLTEADR
jgi:hypothetical protein